MVGRVNKNDLKIMTKLGTYYGLCPLIESKQLCGISKDPEKGTVLVTLGEKIAGRYKLTDQKQLCCWKTKEKFSSPVIYDKKYSMYVAVFNQYYVRLWDSKEEYLDKLKKYKFNQKIHSLFSFNENTYVLFENGNLDTLSNALEFRKLINPAKVICANENIQDFLYLKMENVSYIGLIVRSAAEYVLYWTKCLKKFNFTKIQLDRGHVSLRGYAFSSSENVAHLLTIWSDGRIFSYPIEDFQKKIFPGELITVMQQISTNHSICMLALEDNYVAMFGANSNDEGAILLIYNTHFKVTQSSQSFKLFTNGAKLWNYENNILLPVGQSLAVIPFYLQTEQLVRLLGSHRNTDIGSKADISIVKNFEVVSWTSKHHLRDLHIPKKVVDYFKQGVPQSLILKELLYAICDKDINFLIWCINYFLDIPEKCLARMMTYLTLLSNKTVQLPSDQPPVILPFDLEPCSTSELILARKVIYKKYSEVLLLPYLRSEFLLLDIVKLRNTISILWCEDHLLITRSWVETYINLIEWSCVIIDANYQKLLFCKDDYVKIILNQLNGMVDRQLIHLDNLNHLLSILNYVKTQIKYSSAIANISKKYYVEYVHFY